MTAALASSGSASAHERGPAWARRVVPALDLGLAATAAAIWYVRPQAGLWPLGLIAAGWLLRLAVYGRLTRRTPFDAPLALFLATALLAASAGYNQGSEWVRVESPLTWAWAKLYYILAALGLYYAIANLPEQGHVWWLARGLALFAAGVAAYFLLTNDWGAAPAKMDLLSRATAWLAALQPELPGRALHPNVAGGLVAMTLPYFVPLVLDSRKRKAGAELAWWLAAAAVALTGLVMSMSRGAWLAVVGVAALWIVLRAASARGRVAVLATTGLMFAALMAVLIATPVVDVLASSPVVAAVPGVTTAVSRLDLARGAWTLAQDTIFTGAGLGAFSMLLTAYVMPVQVFYLLHSHNLLLNLLVEQGILGLTSFLWLLTALAVLALRGLRRPPGARGTAIREAGGVRLAWLLQASLAGAAVTLLHGLTDDIGYGSRAILLIFVPFAVAAALLRDLPGPAWRVPWLGIAGAAALLAGLLLWQRDALAGAWFANQGALAQARAELATYRFPDRLPEPMRREADLSQAIGSYERALGFDAAQRTANQRLAGIALARADYPAALVYAETAYTRDPADPVTWQLLGDAHLAMGHQDEAYAWWSHVPAAELLLQTEAQVRYQPVGDTTRAGWVRALAERVRAGRGTGDP